MWSVAAHRLLFRAVGHSSWVTSVSFDPFYQKNTGYRFGSVGQDCKLLLWEFSEASLEYDVTCL